jgi:hypothetical protein
MAHTIEYLETNGVRITNVDVAIGLVLNVYQMNSGHTYDLIVSGVIIPEAEYYDVEYPDDGVYKITLLPTIGGAGELITYADVNNSNYATAMSSLIKPPLYTTNATIDDFRNLLSLYMLGLRYFCFWEYTPADETDFTDATVIADLQKIYDATARTTKYINNVQIDLE